MAANPFSGWQCLALNNEGYRLSRIWRLPHHPLAKIQRFTQAKANNTMAFTNQLALESCTFVETAWPFACANTPAIHLPSASG